MISAGMLAEARRRLRLLGPRPAVARQIEASLLMPVSGEPSERLIDTGIAAIEAARSVDLSAVSARASTALAEAWPGEHYRLLAGLVQVLEPATVVELGTATGMSALAMMTTLPAHGRLVTFDLRPWRGHPDVVLRDEDFASGRLEQCTDDLTEPASLEVHADLLRSADLIFVDTKHDGDQERSLLKGFAEVGLSKQPIVVLDDIRLWNMLSVWQEITRPKLDLTSFGHWSGTGLVDWR